MNLLKVLKNDDHLYTMVNPGIFFHNCDILRTWFSGCESQIITSGSPSNPKTEVDIFAPHGKVVEVELPDEQFLVISTPKGPLEIYRKWNGGIPTPGVMIFPNGDIVSEDEVEFNEEQFIQIWEEVYPRMDFGGSHVDFKLRD